MHLTEFVQRFELILLPIMVDEKLVKDEDGFFVNNRFAIAQSAQRRGIEISVKVYEAGFGPLYFKNLGKDSSNRPTINSPPLILGILPKLE